MSMKRECRKYLTPLCLLDYFVFVRVRLQGFGDNLAEQIITIEKIQILKNRSKIKSSCATNLTVPWVGELTRCWPNSLKENQAPKFVKMKYWSLYLIYSWLIVCTRTLDILREVEGYFATNKSNYFFAFQSPNRNKLCSADTHAK